MFLLDSRIVLLGRNNVNPNNELVPIIKQKETFIHCGQRLHTFRLTSGAWVWYPSDYVTWGFNTEAYPVSLSDAFDRVITLPLPTSPSFSLHPSQQVKCPQQWKINSQVQSVVMGIKAIKAGTAENESLTSLGSMLWHAVPLATLIIHGTTVPLKPPGFSSEVTEKQKFWGIRQRLCMQALNQSPFTNAESEESFNKRNEKCPAYRLGGSEWWEVKWVRVLQ